MTDQEKLKTTATQFLNKLITDETPVKDLETIKFIKKCVSSYFKTVEETAPDWQKYFEILWKMYPRKVEKQNAKKAFEHKIRGLNEQELKDKCNLIYKAEIRYLKELQDRQTPNEYVKHFSSWLNAEVPNSKNYKGV